MKPPDLRQKLTGVIAFPITPFRKDDGSVDVEGLHKNLQPILRTPVAAIVAAAGTGELYSLDVDEHLKVIKAVVQEVNGRVPVIAGTGFNSVIGERLAKQAADAGASGILAFPPYYPSPDDGGLIAYYAALGRATELGLIIYSRDWFAPTAAQVEAIAKEIPTLIAWKDGQADIRRYQMVRRRVGDRLTWIGGAGDDMVPGYYAMGVRAYTSSISNVAPKLSVKLHELASNDPHSAELTKLMDEIVIPLYALRAKRKGYEVSAMKALMDEVGLVGGKVRPPLVDVSEEDLKMIRASIPRWKEWI
jgi:5-dehydro-4-deoxyglucarate dehydratase